jgi:hypothetical protein
MSFNMLAQGARQRPDALSDDLSGLLSNQKLFCTNCVVHERWNFAMGPLDVCIETDFAPRFSTT